MNRTPLGCLACGLLFIVALPVILPVLLVLLLIQLLTGQALIRMDNWRPWQTQTPSGDEPENDIPASEAIIDAQVVDLPDPPEGENRDD
ncbi:MAG: hypothetical protein LBM70_10025 [Victivallales bacterium]|jgi:hypothetical protein|nr:hypothetical protein [Victivallales bacterium]